MSDSRSRRIHIKCQRYKRMAGSVEPPRLGLLLGLPVLMRLGFSLIANNQVADAIPVLEKAVTLSVLPVTHQDRINDI
jgi:hypothetical protein